MPCAQADRVYSEAHDDLYQFSFESRRWFPCSLRRPRGAAALTPAPAAQTAADAEPTGADDQSAADSSGSGQTADGDSGVGARAVAPEAAAAGTVRYALERVMGPCLLTPATLVLSGATC